MPTVTSGKVLVTGANGFVAAWIVKELLDRGYAVRGTVRSEAKAAPLRSFFGTYGDKFETAIVEDITKVRDYCCLIPSRLLTGHNLGRSI